MCTLCVRIVEGNVFRDIIVEGTADSVRSMFDDIKTRLNQSGCIFMPIGLDLLVRRGDIVAVGINNKADGN